MINEFLKKSKEALKKRKAKLPYDMLGRSLALNPFFPKDVIKALKRVEKEFKIIAELKSPRKGMIKQDFDPLTMALNYQKNKAAAICVVTQEHFFGGSLEHLALIRRYTKLPLLRKDFIFDEYQILEALVYGADFILLIAKMLSIKELKRLLEFARHLGLQILVEIRDKEDLSKAIFAGSDLISINHFNLEDFSMDMNLCEKLIPYIPNSKIIIAQGGLGGDKEFLKHLQDLGVDAFLIDEYLMEEEAFKTLF